MQRPPTKWGTPFANHISDQRPITGTYKEFNSQDTNNFIKKRADDLSRYFSKGDIQVANGYLKIQMFNITNHQGKANQNYQEITFHLFEWLLSKRQEATSIGEKGENRKPVCIAGGNANECSCYSKQ